MSEAWYIDSGSTLERIADVLEEFGVAIIPDALGRNEHRSLCEELFGVFDQTDFCEGLFYGHRTKRFGAVLRRSKCSQYLALNDLSLGAAKAILASDCEDLQLNLTQAIDIWPGSFAQVPHRDQDIWLGSTHRGEMMINAMWALDDFTEENGATMVWPGSHREPDKSMPDRAGVSAVMPKGSLCLFLGSTLHSGGANWSAERRRGLIISYCLGWLKPCENPWLSYPPHVARDFAPALSRLVGYRQDAPNLNNVDGRCPSHLLQPISRSNRFTDRMNAQQIAQIEEFNAMQLSPEYRAA